MARSFTAQDTISLPRLGATEAAVLMKQLITGAEAKDTELKGKLPASIRRTLGRLAVAHTALDEATLPQVDETDTEAKRKADRVVDRAWSATFRWLGGWCKLPASRNPHLAESLALFQLAFPDALSFTKLKYRIQWKESQARLDAIKRDGHDKTFKQLGGEVFLQHLRETQEAYGKALHITAPLPDQPSSPEVRPLLDAGLVALRDFVMKVGAHADPDVEGSEALSEALLRPLSEWVTQRSEVGTPGAQGTPTVT